MRAGGLLLAAATSVAAALGGPALAAMAAVLLRANLAIAVTSTLVTNPFTFAPVYFLAYQFGEWLLDDQGPQVTEAVLAEQMSQISVTSTGWIDRIGDIAAPLFTGLGLFAVVGALLSYLTVTLLWRLAVVMRYRKRQRRFAKSLGE